MRYSLVTYDHHLVFSGDMGCYVFYRIEDMFRFFRRRELSVNESYWSEKVIAEDRERVTEYSPDLFKQKIKDCLEEYILGNEDLSHDDALQLRDEVNCEVLWHAEEGEDIAVSAARGFEFNAENVFQDFYECNVKSFTYRFLWCCWAIVWGIQQYDDRNFSEGIVK